MTSQEPTTPAGSGDPDRPTDEELARTLIEAMGPLTVLGMCVETQPLWNPHPVHLGLDACISDGIRAIPVEEPPVGPDALSIPGDEGYDGPCYDTEPSECVEVVSATEVARRNGILWMLQKHVFPRLPIPMTTRVQAAIARAAMLDSSYFDQLLVWTGLEDMKIPTRRPRGLDLEDDDGPDHKTGQ